MRWLVPVSVFALVCATAQDPAVAQTEPRHHIAAIEGGDWAAWRGHDAAYLTEHLGEPDRRTGARWHYDYVTVGTFDGPYRIWRLTFVVRGGRVASVQAVYVAGVGCDLYE